MADVEVGNPANRDGQSKYKVLSRGDSLHLEAGRVSNLSFKSHHEKEQKWRRTFLLAFQTIGVVYGDVGTSPLYTYSSTFTNGIQNQDDIYGALSLIIYTLFLITFIKYVFIVLWANDNGDGGTFAVYSKICRHMKVSLVPNSQPEDAKLSNYNIEVPSRNMKRAQFIKEKLENSQVARVLLFLCAIIGTSMVIGDGILTPVISVLSAVSGIQIKATSLTQNDMVGISIAILIVLFAFQRYGTDKVGFAFAPCLVVWFTFIACTGVYNLFKHDVGTLRAFNPKYIYDYFKRNKKSGWISLGGIVLCITGTEAMFADLGHFSVRSIQISFAGFVFPSLLCAYIGQAAYLRKFPENVATVFYDSIPHPFYWPQFVIAVIAAIIASQAMISGTFSIIAQSQSLGCFPRVKVIHTSKKYEGQVYIPEVNYALMIGCVIVTAVFKNTTKIGNAYGICVVAVMLITTSLITLIMLTIWKISIVWIVLFAVIYGVVEIIYLSAALDKFVQGGYLPLAFSAVLMTIMGIWHYVHKEKYIFELNNKVSSDFIRNLAMNPRVSRVPGIGILFSELVQGIPPIFPHFISNIPSIHSVLVFVSIKNVPVGTVTMEERFLFRQVEPRDYRIFRCVVRYGYKDVYDKSEEFEKQLIQNLKQFILDSKPIVHEEAVLTEQNNPQSIGNSSGRIVSSRMTSGPILGAEDEIQFIDNAREEGVVYLLGELEVVAKPGSLILKKIIVNYAYNFLRKNFRQGQDILAIPQSRLLKVGMIYEI